MNFSVLRAWVLIHKFFSDNIKKITADTLGWMAAIALHFSTVPGLLAVMTGLSDKTSPLDMVMFVYATLVLMFARAILLRDQLNIITIGVGFIGQATMMAFILFK